MNRQRYLIKNVGILTLSNFASKILVFLLVPLYTSTLTTSEYGTADLLTTTISIFTPLLTLNIMDAVMRYAMDKNYDRKDIFAIGEQFSAISVIIVLIFVGVNHVEGFSPIMKQYEIFIIFSYAIGTYNNLLTQFAKGIEKVREMGIAGVIGTIATITCNIVFLVVMKMGLNGYLLAMVLSSFTQLIYMFFAIKAWKFHNKVAIKQAVAKDMLLYCIPLLATTVGWWINSAADKYTVTYLVGVSATGLISVSYKIPQVLNVLESIFIQAWQISAIKEYGGKAVGKFYGKTFKTINLLMCMACSLLIVMDRPLAHFLYARDFYVAWRYVPFLLISTVFTCASGLLGPILSAKKDSKSMMWSAVLGAAVNITLNVALVSLVGIQGATIATAVSSFSIYLIRKKAVGEDIQIDQYTNVMITWGLLCMQGIIEIYLENYIVEALIMAIMLAINLKGCIQILDMIKKLIMPTQEERVEGE